VRLQLLAIFEKQETELRESAMWVAGKFDAKAWKKLEAGLQRRRGLFRRTAWRRNAWCWSGWRRRRNCTHARCEQKSRGPGTNCASA